MKRIFSLLLALMLVLSLVGCGQVNAPTTSTTEPTVSTTAPTEPAINEQILVSNESVIVKVVGSPYTTEDNYIGPVLDLYFENLTDMTLHFHIHDVYINDFKVDSLIETDVMAGMKTNTALQFYADDITTNGIETITTVTFICDVYDTAEGGGQHWPVWETYTVNFN